jgi:hypothetical protein
VEGDLELGGDEELKTNGVLYYKNPGDEYVPLYVSAAERQQFDTEN